MYSFLIGLIILILYNFCYAIFINLYKCQINKILNSNKILSIEELYKNNPDILELPITNFYINSSHNTYIGFTQHVSIITTSPLIKALKMGVRCIELDISPLLSYPIVAHGDKGFITTSYLSLEKELDIINKYGFNTSDPLILSLEIHKPFKPHIINQIKDLLINKFKDRLLSYNSLDKKRIDFTNIPIKFLLNKIIIVGTMDDNNILASIYDDDKNMINNENLSKIAFEINKNNQLSRIYPSPGINSYLSKNFYPIKYWNLGHNIITMNYQVYDKNLLENVKFFKNSSFILKNDINIINYLKKKIEYEYYLYITNR